jgi:signal peptidase II
MRLPNRTLFAIFFVASFVLLCLYIRQWAQFSASTVVCNTGGAFSVPLAHEILILLAGLSLLYFGVQWWLEKDSLLFWSFSLIVAGGLSNMAERVWFGCVTDYMSLTFLPSFPMFNLADLGLTLGAGGALLSLLMCTKKK